MVTALQVEKRLSGGPFEEPEQPQEPGFCQSYEDFCDEPRRGGDQQQDPGYGNSDEQPDPREEDPGL